MNIKAEEFNEKKSVNHYLEANISTNYIVTGGNRIHKNNYFAKGFHIAHGSNITPVHALVMSYGQDYMQNNNAVLTAATFFLRRYMPERSMANLLLYSTIGSAFYSYKTDDVPGVLENAGIIIGVGIDWIYTPKLRLSLEADYRGFTIKQFGNRSSDYIRPVTLFMGLKYYYLTTHY